MRSTGDQGSKVTFQSCLQCCHNQVQLIFATTNPPPKQTDTALTVIQHIKSHSIKRIHSSCLPNCGNLNPQAKRTPAEGNMFTQSDPTKRCLLTSQLRKVLFSFSVQE